MDTKEYGLGDEVEGLKLTPKEQRFVEEYPIDFNGVRAVKRAGYKPKNINVANQIAMALLQKPTVAEAMAKKVKALADKSDSDLKKTFAEVRRLSFSDIRKVFNEKGELKQVHELDDDTAAAIAAMEVEEVWEGRGADREFKGYRTKIKFWDKNSALDKMSRYHALYKDAGTPENPVSHKVEIIYERLHTEN